jgi:Restriction endonuclease
MKPPPKWQDFELLVKRIQEQLSPFAECTHNAIIRGHDSGVDRQIDVAVRQRIGQFDIFIAIECKDYNRPLDVKDVETFIAEMKDVRANKGVIVSAKGFTTAGITIAKHNSVDTFRLIDAQSINWPIKLQIPIICKLVNLYSYQFTFEVVAEGGWHMPYSPTLFDQNHFKIGSVIDFMMEQWNIEGPTLPSGLRKSKYALFFDCEGQHIPFTLTICFDIRESIYFKFIRIDKLQGFVDEQTNKVYTNHFQTALINFDEIEKSWNKIESVNSINCDPKIICSFIGLFKDAKHLNKVEA